MSREGIATAYTDFLSAGGVVPTAMGIPEYSHIMDRYVLLRGDHL